jgi:hypothetical protein
MRSTGGGACGCRFYGAMSSCWQDGTGRIEGGFWERQKIRWFFCRSLVSMGVLPDAGKIPYGVTVIWARVSPIG